MITTNRKDWADRVRYLTTQAKDDPLEYIHHEIGYNYRLTNVQAAIGLAQLEQLKNFIVIKNKIATRYTKALQGIDGLTFPSLAPWAEAYHWLYTILIEPKKFGKDRNQLMKSFSADGIQSRPLWHPLDTLKPFKSCFSYQVGIAYRLYKQALSLPSSYSLTSTSSNVLLIILKGWLDAMPMTIYVEFLTVKCWLNNIVPHLRRLARENPSHKPRCYIFDGTPLALWLAHAWSF